MEESRNLNIDFRYYWGVIHRRRYLALVIALTVISVFTWGGFLMPKVYESSATVYIQGASVINPLMQGVGVTVSIEERLRNLRNILTSRNLVERVIKKLNLDAKVKNPVQYESLIDDIQKNLKVSVRSGGANASDLFFTISYRGTNPQDVAELVKTHIQECISISENSRTQDASGAYAFIDKELDAYREKLEASDKLIREFREQHPTMVPQSETTMVSRIENFQTSRADAEIKLRELEKRRENIKKQLAGEKELTVAFVSRDGSTQGRLDALNSQLMMLLTKYTDDYPEVMKVRSEIDELQKQIGQATKVNKDQAAGAMSSSSGEMRALNPIYRQLKEELSRTDTEIETLQARKSEIIRQQAEGQAALRKMPKDQEEWAKLQRNRNVYQRIHDDLLNRLESARVSKDLELGSNTVFRVMDPPIQTNIPVSPNRVKLILLGLFLGLFSGIGAVIVLDYFDPTFKREDLIESDLKMPLLASIPMIVTEEDKVMTTQLDKKYFKVAVIYLGVIGLVLIEEVVTRFLGIGL